MIDVVQMASRFAALKHIQVGGQVNGRCLVTDLNIDSDRAETERGWGRRRREIERVDDTPRIRLVLFLGVQVRMARSVDQINTEFHEALR